MPWLKLRKVVPTDECEIEILETLGKFKRFEDAWNGLRWLLERNPTPVEAFLSLSIDGVDYYLYGFEGDRAADIPTMWVFYHFTDDEVVVHGINAIEAPEPDEIA
jgi:hypothetical protein